MSACAATTVYTTDQADASLELRDFTKAIQAASTNEERRTLLAQKQAALDLLHPPRLVPERAEHVETDDVYTTRAGQDWRRCCMIQLRREWGRFSNFSFRAPQRRISAYPARPSG